MHSIAYNWLTGIILLPVTRPPELQLKILKYITQSGRMSKANAAEICGVKYGDLSDAMDALSRNDFIKFSETWRRRGSRKHRRLYKIQKRRCYL